MTDNDDSYDAIDDVTLLKKKAAEAAAEYVKDGMVVGLGTGSTVEWAIRKLGQKVQEGLNIIGIPTSERSEKLAKELEIPLTTLLEHPVIDLTIDGADEVDPNLCLIKGGGAALLREKILAEAAKQFIIIVDSSKMVQKLGLKMPVPVEVIPPALSHAIMRIRQLGGSPIIRQSQRKAGPIITDNGNFILDVSFESIENPSKLETHLNTIPGVLENGLFTHQTDLVYIGEAKGVKCIQR